MIVCYSSPPLLVIRISYVQNAAFSQGLLLKPCHICHIALKEMTAHFQGQTIPQACIHPILLMIMCYNSISIFMIWNLDFKNAKISRGRPLRPFLYRRFALTTISAHFQVQMRAE